MTVAASPVTLDDWFARDLGGLYQPWQAAPAPAPELVALNAGLAGELGLDPEALRAPEGVAILAGAAVPAGATPVAQAYAGHQFGNYSPRLGDGRALLLGELTDPEGRRHDLHLKGSGRTPFARGGDGLAPLGPMLREYVIGEAMHALGIPTTRALSVVTTGEAVVRDGRRQPGAVLARIASSHLRVGTFQYAAATRDADLLRRLTDHAIARHHPQAAQAERPALALLAAVVEAQAALVAQWMDVGFVHGVMNTDNMTISGETIDYGPCAFLDAYDPATVYSSIDHGGRYAYGNQPQIAQWNLARLAEALLTQIDEDTDAAIAAATDAVSAFGEAFTRHRSAGLHAKLGLTGEHRELVEDLVRLLTEQHPDHTRFFRGLSAAARGDGDDDRAPVRDLVVDRDAVDAWLDRWRAALRAQERPVEDSAAAMDRVNPVYIPRNHQVEAALDAAIGGDHEPFGRLVDVVSHPFDERPGLEDYAKGDPSATGYVTYCGT